ncbi:hypothetical protein [Croceiramulus getboli]|nr:hypothetical protein P8624_12220 [Flavobacteriaceae bacterium YJPT1-3]
MNKSKESFCEAEQRRVDALINFRLPHRFKLLGYLIAGGAFLTLFILKQVSENIGWERDLLQKLMLIGLLVVVLAKEKVEDERIQFLRGRAFSISFILGVIYAAVLPYIETAAKYLIKGETVDTRVFQLGDFQLLLYMLMIYIGFFQVLKRRDS